MYSSLIVNEKICLSPPKCSFKYFFVRKFLVYYFSLVRDVLQDFLVFWQITYKVVRVRAVTTCWMHWWWDIGPWAPLMSNVWITWLIWWTRYVMTVVCPPAMHAPCHTCPLPCMPPPCTPPAMHTPLSCMLHATHAHHTCAPYHNPSPHICPPATHATPQNKLPPAMHTLSTMHAPPATHAPPPMDRMRDVCKNITLPQTSFAGGNKAKAFLYKNAFAFQWYAYQPLIDCMPWGGGVSLPGGCPCWGGLPAGGVLPALGGVLRTRGGGRVREGGLLAEGEGGGRGGGGLLARGVLPCHGGSPCRGSPCHGGSPCWGVLPVWGGSPCQGGLLAGGVSPCRGGSPYQRPPPVDRITDACKNITLAQVRCGRLKNSLRIPSSVSYLDLKFIIVPSSLKHTKPSSRILKQNTTRRKFL